MAINFDKIKNKQTEEASKGRKSYEYVQRFKLKTGENRIRLMPPWTDEGVNADQFWVETYTHWNVGQGGYDEENGRRFTCPVKTPNGPGGACEVCDLAATLRASDDPADQELSKLLYAKRSFISNVINLKDPVIKDADVEAWQEAQKEGSEEECPFEVGDTKVQMWSYPASIYKDLLDVFSDGLDITDMENGNEVIVTKEGSGLSTRYRVRINPKSSAVKFQGDATKLTYNLDNQIRFPEPGDMVRALNGETSRPVLPAAKASIPSLPPKKAAKAVKTAPAAQVEETSDDEDPEPAVEASVDDPPACFKDSSVHSATDPQCVGGVDEDGNEYDACPHFEPCKEAVQAQTTTIRRSARTPVTKPKTTIKPKSAIEDMEKRLKDALR
jgi:hypothetical protein